LAVNSASSDGRIENIGAIPEGFPSAHIGSPEPIERLSVIAVNKAATPPGIACGSAPAELVVTDYLGYRRNREFMDWWNHLSIPMKRLIYLPILYGILMFGFA